MRLQQFFAAIGLLISLSANGQLTNAPPRNVADVLEILEQYKPDKAALDFLNSEANAIQPETNDQQELAVFFHKRGRANGRLGNAKGQIADLEQALSLALPSALPRDGFGEQLAITDELIFVSIQAGNYVLALDLARKQMGRDQWGWGLAAAAAVVKIQAILNNLEATREAVKEVDSRIATLRSYSGPWSRYGNRYQRQGEVSHALLLTLEGNYDEAERHFRRNLELEELLHQQLRDAESFRQNKVVLYASINGRATAEVELAWNLMHQSRGAESEYHVRNALLHMLQGSGRFSHYTALAIGVYGMILLESGRFAESESLARASIYSFQKAGATVDSVFLAEARAVLGASLVAQNRWSDAISVFQDSDKALATNPLQYEYKTGRSENWGLALLRTGSIKSSLEMLEFLYRKRLSRGFPQSEYFTAQSRGFYAMALAADGQTEKALGEFRGAVPILIEDARRTGGDQGGGLARQMRLVWILEAYMKLLVEMRDSPLLKAAGLDAMAEGFRIADVARGSKVQRALAESAARATPADPALADLARREQDAQKRFGTLSDLLNRLLSAPPEQQLTKVIADVRRDIDGLRVERDKLKGELETRFPDYADLISPKPTTLDQAQAALATGEALISIYVGADRSYVWAVPKAGVARFAEVRLSESDVTNQVAQLRKALDVGVLDFTAMPAFDLALAHALYRSLLQPVETGWRGAKTLVMVPHKALGELPFALLTTAPAVASPTATGSLFAEYRQVPWLIRQVAVSQLPSVSTLLALRRMPADKTGRKEFIGFGDPLFSKEMALASNEVTSRRRVRNLSIEAVASQPTGLIHDAPVAIPTVSVNNSAGLAQLARLPDTAEEIISIAKVLNADPTSDIFLGPAASEKNVKGGQLDNRRIVMFATHGLVPGDLNGLTQPALALSAPEVTGNSGEDGLLTMEEVLGLKLHADWVVLSACNTAAGSGAGSEAVSGLGKAFFFAGARTLLVSNWPVETVSAKLLTTRLFEYQSANPGSSRAEALRATMLYLMDQATSLVAEREQELTYAHPLFWAPFSLVGDGGG